MIDDTADDATVQAVAEVAAIFDASARFCVANGDRAAYLDWFVEAGPELAPALAGGADVGGLPHARLFRVIGAAVYNELPLPQNGFRAVRTPLPGRNDPCLCGSGAKFKQCCASLTSTFDMSGYSALASVLEHLPEARYAELPAAHVKVADIEDTVDQWLSAGLHERVVALLEPWFAPTAKLTDALEMLFEALMSSYLALRRDADAASLVALLVERGDRPLRAAALRERSLLRLDAGAIDDAWEDFTDARRLAPSHPSNAVIELTLLVSTQRFEEARDRARYWLPRIERERDPALDHVLDLIRRVIDDPQTALDDTAIDRAEYPEVAELERVLATAPPPDAAHYRLEDHGDGEHSAMPDTALRKVEARWTDAFPGRKPLQTDLQIENHDIWDDTAAWLALLAAEPRCWHSFEVIDDLVIAVADILGSDTRDPLLDALLERGAGLLRALLTTAGDAPAGRLPWSWTENRPALRLLAHRAFRAFDDPARGPASDDFITHAEWLLALNPADQHEFRELLVLGYLTRGEPARALALLAGHADTRCGLRLYLVLALFMSGDADGADTALRAAWPDCGRALRLLLEERVPMPPNADPRGIIPGGALEAWVYREAARPLWLQTGALDWLRERLPALRD